MPTNTGVFFCWYSVYLTHIYAHVSAPQGHKKKGWEENMNAAASTGCIDVCSAARYCYLALAYGNDSEHLFKYEEPLVPSTSIRVPCPYQPYLR
jgi:hypothetical protein